MLHYRYTHTGTEATTGYFSCEPVPVPALEDALRLLAKTPLDDFLRRHLIRRMAPLAESGIREAMQNAFPAGPLPASVLALVNELSLLNPDLAHLPAAIHNDVAPHADTEGVPGEVVLSAEAIPSTTDATIAVTETPQSTADVATSLIFLRWSRLPDREAHRQWNEIFNANIQRHRALQAPSETALPPLYPLHPGAENITGTALLPGTTISGNTLSGVPLSGTKVSGTIISDSTQLPGTSNAFTSPFPCTLPALHRKYVEQGAASTPPYSRPPSDETAALAEERLQALNIIAGREMRHTASLSPVALLRPWNMQLSVSHGRLAYCLDGQATTYGRGLSVADARASCLMEMAERASSYLSIAEERILDRMGDAPVFTGSRSAMLDRYGNALDPNDYPLEAPYNDEPLVWMEGTDNSGNGVLVPVQMAGLFCNLDEIALFEAPGSTGIATACTMEEAKLAALLEILERDAEATTPFSKANCFRLEADENDDPVIAALLADYAARGINVQFQDLTGPMGVPVYKCFVMSMKGVISRGHGAGLSARKAVVSAMTETPFPYPDGGPSGPMLRRLPGVRLRDLPEYALSLPADELTMLEELLASNGRPPVYVDLTRKGIGFPVVRALVPGMELAADRDAFSRVPRRLWDKYNDNKKGW